MTSNGKTAELDPVGLAMINSQGAGIRAAVKAIITEMAANGDLDMGSDTGGYMSLTKAAEHFDVSTKQVGRWIDDGELEDAKLDADPRTKRSHVTRASIRRKDRRLQKPR